jgi:addiction module HigA family antidote
MIVSYRDKRTRDFATGKRVKAFSGIERAARLKLDRLEAAIVLKDLAVLPGNRFEALKGDRKGQYSIRINDQWRTCLNGPKTPWAHRTWKSLIIIRRNSMALTAIHPGDHLAEELKELGMSAAELARQLDVPTNRVTEILNGRRAITGDTALRLAHFFGTTAEFWLNLQSLFELRIAQKKAGKSIRALPTLKHLEQAHV